jgi:hypothetical protein
VLVGQQLVLEALGGVVLARLDRGIGARGLGFERLRRLLIAQERSHHAFGLRRLENILGSGVCDAAHLTRLTAPYLEAALGVLDAVAPLLEGLGEDPAEFRVDLVAAMPPWVRAISS